jgi:hypothetical protein
MRQPFKKRRTRKAKIPRVSASLMPTGTPRFCRSSSIHRRNRCAVAAFLSQGNAPRNGKPLAREDFSVKTWAGARNFGSQADDPTFETLRLAYLWAHVSFRLLLGPLRKSQHKNFKRTGSFCFGSAIQVSKHSQLLSRREKTWDGHFGLWRSVVPRLCRYVGLLAFSAMAWP